MPPFPWRVHSKEDLLRDFSNLSDRLYNDKPSLTIQKPLCGYKSTNFFFQKERMKVRSQNKPSAIEYWKKNYEYIINFQKKTKMDLFGTTVFLSFATGDFSPYVAGMIYKYFMKLLKKTPDQFKVLDGYAGWGPRCLAAMALDINYIGCDSNKSLAIPYKKMIKFFQPYSESNVDMIFKRTEEITNLDVLIKESDIFFSSPPFFNNLKGMLEEYPGAETNYRTFMKESLIPVMKKCRNNKKMWVCLYIPENMYDDLVPIFGKAKKIFTFRAKINNMNGVMSKSNTIYCWN
jgi:hypothetical protein